jgi:hypothetical protein
VLLFDGLFEGVGGAAVSSSGVEEEEVDFLKRHMLTLPRRGGRYGSGKKMLSQIWFALAATAPLRFCEKSGTQSAHKFSDAHD